MPEHPQYSSAGGAGSHQFSLFAIGSSVMAIVADVSAFADEEVVAEADLNQ